MKFINEFREGDNIYGIYYCRQKNELRTKSDKPYYAMILQDKTGTIDAKIWDVNSGGIEEFEAGDFVDVQGQVTKFQSALQMSVHRARRCREGEYNLEEYLPTTEKDPASMYKELMQILDQVKAPYYRALLSSFFGDETFRKDFCKHSAAKTLHHGFMGGLLEHTLGVVKICNYMASQYPILNRDLLLVSAVLHDVGKLDEISDFPENDYTDAGQLLGHIYIGAKWIEEKAEQIPDFPEKQKRELVHCILAHHGELEFGSPKKPALIEAMVLSMADNLDAKVEMFTEALKAAGPRNDWLGFNKVMESNIRRTSGEE